MASNWYRDLESYLGGFPDSYLVVDTETQGKDPISPSTLPVQIGFALIVDREIATAEDWYLNWTIGDAAVDSDWFREALVETQASMQKQGKVYKTTWPQIEAHGVEPISGLNSLRDLVIDAMAEGIPIMAHNGFSYDRRLLEHCCRRRGLPLLFDVENMLDTGLFEKARRMEWSPPRIQQWTRHEYYTQVSKAFSPVRWSLDTACSEEYDLPSRHGLDTSAAHTAKYDCIVTHHLFEAMRDRLAA